MPTTYTECTAELEELHETVVSTHCPILHEAGVTVTYLFAANEDGDALKHGGYPAAATVRIVNLKDRVAGLSDAVVCIDAGLWKDYNAKEQAALIHHELAHLIPRESTPEERLAGAWKFQLDDAGRPKLRMRKHDYQTGGFYDVIEAHTGDAIDLQEIMKINKELSERKLLQKELWG